MKLNEKIAYYRRAKKLSQEELAAQVGVSRQAVSKWELGEAAPDIGKLLALAKAFGVTTDHLLSEEEEPERSAPPVQPSAPAYEAPPQQKQAGSDLPGFLGKMVRRWGWLAGIYIALQGMGMTLVGGIARYAFSHMFRRTLTMGDMLGAMPGFSGVGWGDVSGFDTPAVTVMSDLGQVLVNITTVIMAVGILIAIAGLALAVALWFRGKKGE